MNGETEVQQTQGASAAQKNKKNGALRGSLILALGAAIWGCAFVAQNVGMDYIGPLTFGGARSFIGTLTLLPFVLLGEKKERRELGLDKAQIKKRVRGDWLAFLILGLAVTVPTTLQQIGLTTTSPGKSGFITAMYIVAVPVLSILLGKRPGWNVLISVLLGVAGLYFLCVTGELSIERGDMITLISVLFWGVQILLTDRYSKKMNCLKMTCGAFFICGVLSTIMMFMFEKPTLEGLRGCLIPLLYTGVMSTGIAYTLQALGQKTTPPTVASLVMSLESVFAALAGYVILHDALSPRELLGAGLMLCAVVLAQIEFKPHKEMQ